MVQLVSKEDRREAFRDYVLALAWERGISQNKLAVRVGLSRSTLSRLNDISLSREKVVAIGDALECVGPSRQKLFELARYWPDSKCLVASSNVVIDLSELSTLKGLEASLYLAEDFDSNLGRSRDAAWLFSSIISSAQQHQPSVQQRHLVLRAHSGLGSALTIMGFELEAATYLDRALALAGEANDVNEQVYILRLKSSLADFKWQLQTSLSILAQAEQLIPKTSNSREISAVVGLEKADQLMQVAPSLSEVTSLCGRALDVFEN
ncbi:MAG: helix-turn-helix transcriptional regulator [Chloroflexi bacterium]|nr:helix-turn-helix transcriptional regulator [Chloroflexota bacterium]